MIRVLHTRSMSFSDMNISKSSHDGKPPLSIRFLGVNKGVGYGE
jgi:hypothetical protein